MLKRTAYERPTRESTQILPNTLLNSSTYGILYNEHQCLRYWTINLSLSLNKIIVGVRSKDLPDAFITPFQIR